MNMTDEWTERGTQGDLWLPTEENEELVGKVVEEIQGSYGSQWIIEKEDESRIRTPSHKVLQNRMTGIAIDTTVRIIYDGEEPPSIKGQNPTKMYRVYEK